MCTSERDLLLSHILVLCVTVGNCYYYRCSPARLKDLLLSHVLVLCVTVVMVLQMFTSETQIPVAVSRSAAVSDLTVIVIITDVHQ